MKGDAGVCKLFLFWGIFFSAIFLDSNNRKGCFYISECHYLPLLCCFYHLHNFFKLVMQFIRTNLFEECVCFINSEFVYLDMTNAS